MLKWYMLVDDPQVAKDFSSFYAQFKKPQSAALWKGKDVFHMCADSSFEKEVRSIFSPYGLIIPRISPHPSFFAGVKFCGGNRNTLAKASQLSLDLPIPEK
jgi:hypothetical protein